MKIKKQIKEEIKLPTTSRLEEELEKEKYKLKYNKLLKNTLSTILVVISFSILIATLIFPVFKIYGESMTPTLNEGDVVLSIKNKNIKNGDVIVFYYNNKILIKRVIATSSEWVNIDENGNVYVNDVLLKESYIKEKSLGNADIKFPYQVKEGSYFVLGDSRENSIDSRNNLIGTIEEEQIIGKVIFKVWPLNNLGIIK